MNSPLPILQVDAGELPKSVMVVGDPARASAAAGSLDEPRQIGSSREYLTFVGTRSGVPVGVVSHGVGAAGAALCFEDLIAGGVTTIIRAGTAGSLQPDVSDGDLVVATAAVRDEGLSVRVVPESYPAVAHADLTTRLVAEGGKRKQTVRQGIVLTSDLFKGREVLGSNLSLWQSAGVMAVEMEISALFVLASLSNIRAGAIVAIDGNPLAREVADVAYDPNRSIVTESVEVMIDVALTVLAAS